MIIRYPEIAQLIDRIHNDTTHGASELARQALATFQKLSDISSAKNESDLWLEIRETADNLRSVRPSMASLGNAVTRLLKELPSAPVDNETLRRVLRVQAGKLIRLSGQANTLIAGYASGLISRNGTIITHSYSSTVCSAIKTAHKAHGTSAIVTRSGAGCTGIRTASELTEAGVSVVFIDDTALGLYVSRATVAMVGADRVCGDGSLVNGIGTYLLALAAKQTGIPFYVLCETLKFDPATPGYEVELEEKEPSGVIDPAVLGPGAVVKNPYFDITPLSLITSFITETGVIQSRDLLTTMQDNL